MPSTHLTTNSTTAIGAAADRSGGAAVESEVRSYSRRIVAMLGSAQGSTVTDVEGSTYIDFLAGCSALNYGHNDPDMAAALTAYVSGQGIAHTMDLHTVARTSFLESFQRHVLGPRQLSYRVQFTGPTGTNAVEAAMKLARKVTGRTNVIAFTNGFHGVTAGALAATGNQHHRVAPHVPLPGVTRAFFDGYLGSHVDTAEVLDKLLCDPSSGIDPPAAILLETVQAEGGVNVAGDAWLARIREIATRHGALLIVDDIQAGCGRTGPFFSFEPAAVEPDMVVLSKSLSGFGIPLSVLLLAPELDVWEPGEHNGTFRGNNLAFVTARVALDKFWSDDRLSRRVDTLGVRVKQRLQPEVARIPHAVLRGRGLLLGIETRSADRANAIADLCFDAGLILETAGPTGSVVKLLPPLTIERDLLDAGLDIIADAIARTA